MLLCPALHWWMYPNLNLHMATSFFTNAGPRDRLLWSCSKTCRLSSVPPVALRLLSSISFARKPQRLSIQARAKIKEKTERFPKMNAFKVKSRFNLMRNEDSGQQLSWTSHTYMIQCCGADQSSAEMHGNSHIVRLKRNYSNKQLNNVLDKSSSLLIDFTFNQSSLYCQTLVFK